MTAVLVAGTLGLYFVIRAKLDSVGHIAMVDTAHRPEKFTSALNILLLGSDTRSGRNAGIGGRVGCNCSDTIMIVHISPGGHRVTVVSIPRDTMVPVYACAPAQGTSGQREDLAQVEQVNWALEHGGPECVRTTVERQTGIYIDTTIQLNFTGFEKVVNDVGGVNVCVPAAISDPVRRLANGDVVGSGLRLARGEQHIGGRVALEFWRARYALADGGDLARIARDQYLMAQIVKGVLHSGLLTRPATLYRVLGDVATSMATDASTSDLVKIAVSLSGLSARKIQFVTAATVPYPPAPMQLEFAQPQAGKLFAAIAHDRRLPRTRPGGKGKGSDGQPPTVSPSRVRVTVLNGTTRPGLAARVAGSLTKRGFRLVGRPGDTARPTYARSVIEYGSRADLPAAGTLGKLFSSVTLKLASSVPAGTVTLILGSGFTRLKAAGKPLGALSGGFSASSRCRNSAFFGPNLPAPSGKVSCAC